MKILVTGGAGLIGSHTLIELYAAGHTAVVVDNLYKSSKEALLLPKNVDSHASRINSSSVSFLTDTIKSFMQNNFTNE